MIPDSARRVALRRNTGREERMAGIMRPGGEAMKSIGDLLRAAGFGFALLALIGLFLGAWVGFKPYHEMKMWQGVDAEVVQSAITSKTKRLSGLRERDGLWCDFYFPVHRGRATVFRTERYRLRVGFRKGNGEVGAAHSPRLAPHNPLRSGESAADELGRGIRFVFVCADAGDVAMDGNFRRNWNSSAGRGQPLEDERICGGADARWSCQLRDSHPPGK